MRSSSPNQICDPRTRRLRLTQLKFPQIFHAHDDSQIKILIINTELEFIHRNENEYCVSLYARLNKTLCVYTKKKLYYIQVFILIYIYYVV